MDRTQNHQSVPLTALTKLLRSSAHVAQDCSPVFAKLGVGVTAHPATVHSPPNGVCWPRLSSSKSTTEHRRRPAASRPPAPSPPISERPREGPFVSLT